MHNKKHIWNTYSWLLPILGLILPLLSPASALASISFGASDWVFSSTQTITVDATADPVIVVGVQTGSDTGCSNVTGFTYAGAGTSHLAASQEFPSFSANCQYVFYMTGVTPGTDDVVLQGSSFSVSQMQTSVYYGVHQTSPVDDVQTTSDAATSALLSTVTPTDPGDWAVMSTLYASGSYTSLTGGVLRGSSPWYQWGDSDGPIGSSPHDLTSNISATTNVLNIALALFPAASEPTPTPTTTPTSAVQTCTYFYGSTSTPCTQVVDNPNLDMALGFIIFFISFFFVVWFFRPPSI